MKPTPNATDTLVTDPICGMLIDPAAAAGSSQLDGTTHYFCSTSCKSEFDSGHGTIPAAPEAVSSCCGGGGCARG